MGQSHSSPSPCNPPPTNGRIARYARKPIPRLSFPRRVAPPARPRRSASVARCVMSAWNTPWRMTAAWASGAVFPNGNVAASSAASSDPPESFVVDRRIDDRGFDVQIDGHLSHQDLVQQLAKFDGVLRPPLDRLAEQDNSRPCGVAADVDAGRYQAGERDRPIGDHFGRPLHAVG